MITKLIIILILILLIFGIILFGYFFIKNKVENLTHKYFGTKDLKKAIEKSELLASNTPKSISSMENLSLPKIAKDFPDLNINELKRMVESAILKILNSIENKKFENKGLNPKIEEWINSRIEDLKSEIVHFDSIKFHRTSVSKYENNNSIATIEFQTSLEYFYKKGNEIGKKIQDRFRVEFIYIIDESKVDVDKKILGLNCPNCGAPITHVGVKTCVYCGTGINEIVKRVWSLNNIINY